MRYISIICLALLTHGYSFSQTDKLILYTSSGIIAKEEGKLRVGRADSLGNLPASSYLTSVGTGTTNTLVMWTGTNTIGNSPLSNSGSVLTSTSRILVPNGTSTSASLLLGDTRGLYADAVGIGFSYAGSKIAHLGYPKDFGNTGSLVLNQPNAKIEFDGGASSTAPGIIFYGSIGTPNPGNEYARIEARGGIRFQTNGNGSIIIPKVGITNDLTQFNYVSFSNNLNTNVANIGSITPFDVRYNSTNYQTTTHKTAIVTNDYLGGLVFSAPRANIANPAPAATIQTQFVGTSETTDNRFDIVFGIHSNRTGGFSYPFSERLRIKDNGNVLNNGVYEWDYPATSLNLSHNGNWWAYNNITGKMQLTNALIANTIQMTNGAGANKMPVSDANGNLVLTTMPSVVLSGSYNDLTNKPTFTDTNLGNSNQTLTSNRTVTTAGFTTTWTGNSPIFNITSTTANTESNFNLSNPNNLVNIKLDNSGSKHNVTTGGHYFYQNGTYYGGVSNIGISAKSSSPSTYPSFNFIDALTTGFEGTSTKITNRIGGIIRSELEGSVLTVQTDNNVNDVTTRLVLKAHNGVSAFHESDIVHGTGGLRLRTPTNLGQSFEIGATQRMLLNANQLAVTSLGSVSAPDYSFIGASNYGMSLVGVSLSFSAAGSQILSLNSSLVNVSKGLSITETGSQTVLAASGSGAKLFIGASNSNASYHAGTTFTFRDYAATTTFATVNSSGITMASGTNLTLASTSGASGAQAISAQQVTDNFMRKVEIISHTLSSVVVPANSNNTTVFITTTQTINSGDFFLIERGVTNANINYSAYRSSSNTIGLIINNVSSSSITLNNTISIVVLR